ncbi:MAG: glycosyltransferase family 2 protein [Brevefilum sp.]|jgi:glycosyltransferase involved in cell wall biosynthesis
MKRNLFSQIKTLKEYYRIKKSGLFDESYYLQTYPEIKQQKLPPIMHYIKHGWHEGKNPSPVFDTAYYLRENKDIRLSRINPLLHYIQFGMAEDRPANRSQSTDPFTYYSWIEQYDTLIAEDRILMRSHMETFAHTPLISIIMPVYNTPEQFLREALESVLAQNYPNWECCIADDASTEPHIRAILHEFIEKDSRFKVAFRETNGHISAASNTALSMAAGEYVGLLDHDDILREHALYMVAHEINQHPDAIIIYSDEDLIDEFGVRYDPYFKPAWNPDLFYGHNLITHFGVYRRDKVVQAGGFREGYEGAQDWDLAMRISEHIPPSAIRHIPFILYHWRAVIGSTALSLAYKGYAKKAQFMVLQEHFNRTDRRIDITEIDGEFWKIRHLIPDPKPLVSIVIPTRNQAPLLKRCIDSIQKLSRYSHYEMIVVDNQSDDEETLAYFSEIRKVENIKIIPYDLPFNYSAINNFAASEAGGEVFVLLNNDTEVISPDWLDELIGHALRPEIGAVGAMLYYPNDTIQHAGVILGMRGIAGHIYYGSPRGTLGQRGRVRLAQNYSAVTGACMAIQKEKFLKIKGFNEHDLPVAYNDIDLCIRLMEAGYRNLWTPHAELYHHESMSRAYEDTPEKIARVKEEADYLINTWPAYIADDPTYNLNLSLTIPNFSLAFPPRVIQPWRDV